MHELRIFMYDEKEVRTVQRGNETWWVLKDVCEVLGLSNPSIVAERLDDDERTKFNLGRQGETNIINESGLYNVILRSDKPEAKPFKRWVTHEVLPAIRKTGAYMTPETIEQVIMNPDAMITILTELKRLQGETRQQSQIIGELQPKANYVDRILDNKGTMTMTQIAKDYGMSAQRMNSLLFERGVQYKQSGQWFLYAKYHNEGYTHSKTIPIVRSDGTPDTVFETKWTQKGRLLERPKGDKYA